MQGKLNDTREATWQNDRTCDPRGRHVLLWRQWDRQGAGAYDRGIGESSWQNDQCRFVVSPTLSNPLVMHTENRQARQVELGGGLASFVPTRPTFCMAGMDARFAHVCWKTGLCDAVEPDRCRRLQVQPKLTYSDPLGSHRMRTLVDEVPQQIEAARRLLDSTRSSTSQLAGRLH